MAVPAAGHGHTAAAAAWGLTRIDARIDPGNAASQRVAQKAGFVHEATLDDTIATRSGGSTASEIWRWTG